MSTSPLQVPNKVLSDALDYAATRRLEVYNSEGVFLLGLEKEPLVDGYLEDDYVSIAYAGYPFRPLKGGCAFEVQGLLRTPDHKVLLLIGIVEKMDGYPIYGSALASPDWFSMQKILQINRRVGQVLAQDLDPKLSLLETRLAEISSKSRYNQAPEPS